MSRRAVGRPVVAARVVETHAHPLRPHRRRQVGDQVTPGVVLTLDWMRHRRRPQREPVVMLGREHDVARPGLGAQPGQGIEVRAGRGVVEGLDEVVVGVGVAVHLGVVPRRGAALDAHRVEVPLGVGVLPQHPLRPELDQRLLDVGHPRRPAGHRVEAPVEEDAQLGVVEPIRDTMGAHGIPCPLIHGACTLASIRPGRAPLLHYTALHAGTSAMPMSDLPSQRREEAPPTDSAPKRCTLSANTPRGPTPMRLLARRARPAARFCPKPSRRHGSTTAPPRSVRLSRRRGPARCRPVPRRCRGSARRSASERRDRRTGLRRSATSTR